MKLRDFLVSVVLIFLSSCGPAPIAEHVLSDYLPKPVVRVQKIGSSSAKSYVGIEPYVTQYNYATEESFYKTLDSYFQFTKDQGGLFTNHTVVVLPEFIGTWLIATDEDKSVFQISDSKEKETMPSIDAAMTSLVIHNLGSFGWIYLFSKSYRQDTLKETLFRMKAKKMAAIYQSVFSKLANKYQVGIVAGSIVLPKPVIENGTIQITDGPLENVSFYFNADGSVSPNITRKAYPTSDELDFLKPAPITENKPTETPIGRLYTMICADSWYPDVYQELNKTESTIVAIPSLVTPSNTWSEKWPGYSGFQNPADINPAHPGRLTEQMAWEHYSMFGRLKNPNVKAAINVFFRGRLWDLTAGGDAYIMKPQRIENQIKAKDRDEVASAIYILYL